MALWRRLARPGDPAARHGQYLDLWGGLDRDALTAAIQRVIAETPALALRLADPGDGPRQATGLPPMPGFADLSAQPHPVGQALAQMRADLARPLDLAQEPAGALSLFVISPARHLLFLRADALALDACGMACLTHRIALYYAEQATLVPAGPQPDPAADPGPDFGPDFGPPPRSGTGNETGTGTGTTPDPDHRPAPDGARTHLAHRILPADLGHAIVRLAADAGVPWGDVLTALSAALVLRLGGEGVTLGLPRRPPLRVRRGPPSTAAETILPYRPRIDPDIPLDEWLRSQSALIDRPGRTADSGADSGADPPDGRARVVIDVQPFARPPHFPGMRAVRLHVLAAAPAGDLRLIFRGSPRRGLRLELACGPGVPPLPVADLHGLAQGLPAFLAAAVAAPTLGRIPMARVTRPSANPAATEAPPAAGDAAGPDFPHDPCPRARADPPSPTGEG